MSEEARRAPNLLSRRFALIAGSVFAADVAVRAQDATNAPATARRTVRRSLRGD